MIQLAKQVFFCLFLSSEICLFAASEGPKSPSLGRNVTGIGVTGWTNPQNSTSTNNSYATWSGGSASQSNYLVVTGSSFTLVNCSSVTGIMFEVERSTNSTGGIVDYVVRAVKNYVIGTVDRSDVSAWPNVDTYISYGGLGDWWGDTWSCDDIRNGGFGMAISAEGTGISSTARIDHIRATVFYNATAMGIQTSGVYEAGIGHK